MEEVTLSVLGNPWNRDMSIWQSVPLWPAVHISAIICNDFFFSFFSSSNNLCTVPYRALSHTSQVLLSGFTSVCVLIVSALCDGESIKVWELLHPIWPEFDPRKDVADGRKEGFNVFVQGQLDLSWVSFGLSSCSHLTQTHTLHDLHTFTAPSFSLFSVLLFWAVPAMFLSLSLNYFLLCRLQSGRVWGLPLLWSTSVYL